jgi:hypothetical protein
MNLLSLASSNHIKLKIFGKEILVVFAVVPVAYVTLYIV